MVTRAQHALTPGRPTPRPVPGSGEVILDVLEGNSFLEHTATMLRGTRNFVVTGVSGAGVRVFSQALKAPGIPNIHDSWPGIDTLLATGRTATLLESSTTQFNVEVRYGFPETSGGPWDNPPSDLNRPILEIDSSIVIKKTNWSYGEVTDPGGPPVESDDGLGRVIRIKDYKPLEYDEDGILIGLSEDSAPPQGGMVDVPVVITTVRLRRRELPIDSRDRSIMYKVGKFTGKTNSVELAPFPYGGVRTWLVSRIGVDTDDGGESYNVTYELLYNVDTWDARTAYIDPTTGQPGGGIGYDPGVPKNGVKDWRVTGEEDLLELDLQI